MAIQNVNPYTQYNYGVTDTKKKTTTPTVTTTPVSMASFRALENKSYTPYTTNTAKTTTQSTAPVTQPTYSAGNGLPTSSQTLDYQQQLNRYNLQKDQLKSAYDLALSQYGQQEGEAGTTAEKLAQQAYITKKQAERVNPNILAYQGLAQTGYENIANQKIARTYEGSYGNIMSDYQNALNAIKRSRESEKLQYEQNVQNADLGIQEQNQNYQLLSQQALDAFKNKQLESTTTTTANSDFANIKSINIQNTPKDRTTAIKQAYDYYKASGKTVNEATVLAGQYADYLGLK